MKNIVRSFIVALMLCALFAGLSGCKKKEGPAERAGREIDKAAEKSGQQIDKAVDSAGEKMKNAGEKIKDSVK